MRAIFWLGLPLSTVMARTAFYKGSQPKVKESITSPRGWVKHAPAPPSHVLELKIALPQPKFDALEQYLWEASDPGHERYGAYLSKEETYALMSPHRGSVEAVVDWLASYGFEEGHLVRSPANDWITIRAPVSLAEKMLDTTYHVYHHAQKGDTTVRTLSYSLPENLHGHVDFIQPTTMFARFKAFKSTLHWSGQAELVPASLGNGTITGPAGNQVDASCNSTITLTCLRQLYNALNYTTSATNGNKLGLTGYLNQYANLDDLQQFYLTQNPAALGSNFTFVSVHGGTNNQSLLAAGDEADLDTQFGFGLTYPTPGTFYSTAGEPPFTPSALEANDTNEPYSYWLGYVLSQDDIPQTISTSYGDDEQTVPYNYAVRVCNEMAALGARGVSVIFSSGDGGVGDNDADPATQQCFTNDGRNVTRFVPFFPATCPYITAVGSTAYIPEKAIPFSGGGFSNYFPRPPYQELAAQGYIDKLAPGTYQGLYNPYGRGVPDVSTQGLNFSIFWEGKNVHVSGTSCSAPTFAAFISMLNDARISLGLPPLGFLNPFLYSSGYKALNDITEGNNPGCGTEGFNATVGWDPGKSDVTA
ncbi:subtilisin-like protein [Leucogyrophana mollusca]|uniref:Subtilisin-like protein n=1 Tax=Leucogyrophana mollusca TaxID=85980 RepID=A0ACB8BE82_9AGAM|nr:subtilisin-like protein [Leucogyrophana mollusca]